MKNTMRFKALLLSGVIAATMLSGCGNEASTTPETTAAATETTTQAMTAAPIVLETEAATKPVSVKEGMERSALTGEWITPETANRRPFAFMINNVKEAIPQSGIARAEVLYEAYVEGNITRLMMITQNYDGLEKIGPVRSCREYYIFFAKEYEATYVHFGRSILAVEQLAKEESNSLDGNSGWCNFFRSTDRVAPHNAYTTTAGVLDSMAKKGISEELPANFTQPLLFNQYDDEVITPEGGVPCNTFKPGYSYNNPYFEYNSQDGLYYRYQFGDKHVDMETGDQLAFSNILVKYVDSHLFDNYTPVLTLEGTGEGLFITNGQAVKVNWKKETKNGATRYYYANGEEIVLNQGKVMVCVVQTNCKEDVVVE